MIDFRLGIETEAAALAAARLDAAGRTAIQSAMDAFVAAAPEDAVEADFRFHRAVAAASWQPLLRRPARLTRSDDDHASPYAAG